MQKDLLQKRHLLKQSGLALDHEINFNDIEINNL